MHSVGDVNILDDGLHIWDAAMPLAIKYMTQKVLITSWETK